MLVVAGGGGIGPPQLVDRDTVIRGSVDLRTRHLRLIDRLPTGGKLVVQRLIGTGGQGKKTASRRHAGRMRKFSENHEAPPRET